MQVFKVPAGFENDNNCCPFCGFVENTPPKIITHLHPGTILHDRYIIGTVIGAGGFGVTYKAWDQTFDIVVAIKEHFPAGLVQRTPRTKQVIVIDKKQEYLSGLNRFMEEARTLVLFSNNPNIVKAENFFEENNTAYLIMEYLDGVSLKDFLKSGNVLDVGDTEHIFVPVMNALKDIHSKGIVHRDISPDNIIICSDGKVKLLDFGAARLSDKDNAMTRSIILKPGFAPPEQYQNKSKQGPWTDIYALCATMYKAVTGELPDESVNRIIEDEVVAPMEIRSSVPEYLSNTIMKGMAISPELRFQNIDDLMKAFYQEKKVVDPRVDLRRRKLRRVITIVAAALVIALTGGLSLRKYLELKNRVKLEDTTLSIWVPYNEERNETEAKEYVECLMSHFQEQNSEKNINVILDIKAVNEDEYYEKLTKAAGTADMPDLFVSDEASEELLQYASTNEEMMDVYLGSNIREVLFVSSDNSMSSMKKFPTGFYVPAVYVRRGRGVDIDTATVESIDEILSGGEDYYVSEEYEDIICKSFGIDITDQKWIEYRGNKKMDDQEAYQKFIDGELTYYISSTEDFRRMQGDAAGLFTMRPLESEQIQGKYSQFWSINKGSSKKDKKAAEIALTYLLMEDAQVEEHLTYKNSIPLNKDAYEEFINNDEHYNFLNDYMDNIEVD